ncbi:hypothetical protein, partial [Streptococcus pneumoniae]|uniref:hypothetical protein n=1 Tax=Streptococcus pneumoniae TaxID=1313 RepID=UPI001CD7BFB4
NLTRKSPYINLYEEFFTSQLSKSRKIVRNCKINFGILLFIGRLAPLKVLLEELFDFASF